MGGAEADALFLVGVVDAVTQRRSGVCSAQAPLLLGSESPPAPGGANQQLRKAPRLCYRLKAATIALIIHARKR